LRPRPDGYGSTTAKFHIYKSGNGEYRWRLVSGNGQVIATPGEGYSTKESAKDNIAAIKRDAPAAEIVDET